MTKRKPFASVKEEPDRALIQVCVDGKIVAECTEDVGMILAEYTACLLNAAHDKAVREAVEEFRERRLK